MKKQFLRLYDNVFIRMDKAVPADTYKHSDKLGAGANKRKKLKNPDDKFAAVMHEFKTGKLHSGSGAIVTDPAQARAIAGSESGKFMKEDRKEYELDSEQNVRDAISHFSIPRNHEGYDKNERRAIAQKICTAAQKYNIKMTDEWRDKFGLNKMQKASDTTAIQEKIIAFLKKNPNPKDEDFHKFVERLGKEHSIGEQAAYKLLGSVVAEGLSNKGEKKKINPEQLAMGIKVEMEHTSNKIIAEKIARDHLTEFPDYYTALAEMEKNLKMNKAGGMMAGHKYVRRVPKASGKGYTYFYKEAKGQKEAEPRKVNNLSAYTEQQHEKDIEYLSKLPLSELRKRQSLIEPQRKAAIKIMESPDTKARGERGLKNLSIMEDHLQAAVDIKEFGDSTPAKWAKTIFNKHKEDKGFGKNDFKDIEDFSEKNRERIKNKLKEEQSKKNPNNIEIEKLSEEYNKYEYSRYNQDRLMNLYRNIVESKSELSAKDMEYYPDITAKKLKEKTGINFNYDPEIDNIRAKIGNRTIAITNIFEKNTDAAFHVNIINQNGFGVNIPIRLPDSREIQDLRIEDLKNLSKKFKDEDVESEREGKRMEESILSQKWEKTKLDKTGQKRQLLSGGTSKIINILPEEIKGTYKVWDEDIFIIKPSDTKGYLSIEKKTGLRIESGTTMASTIENTQFTLARKGQDEFRKALNSAKKIEDIKNPEPDKTGVTFPRNFSKEERAFVMVPGRGKSGEAKSGIAYNMFETDDDFTRFKDILSNSYKKLSPEKLAIINKWEDKTGKGKTGKDVFVDRMIDYVRNEIDQIKDSSTVNSLKLPTGEEIHIINKNKIPAGYSVKSILNSITEESDNPSLQKASALLLDALQKAKAVPVGTVSGQYKKVAEGKWERVKAGKETTKEPEKKDDKKGKEPEKKAVTQDASREKMKGILKKMASILADAFSGKSAVQPAGEAIEQTGENIKPTNKKKVTTNVRDRDRERPETKMP
jgi:hypothetical protein